MENYCVYRHTNIINGKQYIGITMQDPESRWGINGINYKSSPHFWNAITKYGWENFNHEVLYRHLSKIDACIAEKILIREYQTQNNKYGYNVMEGGSAPSIPQCVRDKMSVAMRGNKNGVGKECSMEKRRKISESQKGRKLTDEHRKKLSNAKKGKHHASPSQETRKKISDSHKKKAVYCQELNEVFPSIQECARSLGLQATLICACCKGKHKTTGGFHFQYYNDNT